MMPFKLMSTSIYVGQTNPTDATYYLQVEGRLPERKDRSFRSRAVEFKVAEWEARVGAGPPIHHFN